MGLGVYFRAVPQSRKSASRLLSGIGEALPSLLRAAPFYDWTALTGDESRINLDLHPAAEDVEFFLDDGDQLICSAKTSTCGPGYHACLIDLLDQLARRLKVTWRGVDDEGCGDETDYSETRSFDELQRHMLIWLRAVASQLGEYDDTQFSINMPLSFGSLVNQRAGESVTPLGPFTSDWFRRIANDDVELYRVGGDFFPWWNQPCDALFWKRLALVNSWCNLTWVAPQTEEQEQACRLTLAAFDRARLMDPDLPLPQVEIEELRQLLTSESDDPPISVRTRIGYRRHAMRRPLPGGWTIEVPGYFDSFDEDDGGTTVYWFAGRTLRGSSFTMEKKGSPPRPAQKILDDMFASETEGEETVFDERHADPPGFAVMSFESDGQDEYWRLRGFTARPGGLCIITICYPSKGETSWAEYAWRSLKAPHRPQEDT